MDVKNIKDPLFLKDLNNEQLNDLANDIRQFIIQSVSRTGGHLSSNLGIVELTIALHYVFNSPTDKIFFDVGHQAYVHKILTGRANEFDTLRKYHGLSGFQKRCESPHDVWEAGHSSTALSAAVAMAVARDLNHDSYHVVPVIGDGAMVGGESLEALNHLGSIENKVIIILNDNQMAITKSIGGFNNFLSTIRLSDTYHHFKDDYKNALSKGKIGTFIYQISKSIKDFIKHGLIDDTIFEDFGIDYLGPVDGHNISELIRVFNIAKISDKSVVVHVITKKGKGYLPAENDKAGKWHGTEPFNISDGSSKTSPSSKISWSQVLADHVEKWMEKDKDIVAITPAMINGSALQSIFQHYPQRSFDVGIAEEHALTFTAGLSISRKKPFISVYSSFIQRAYDQINHDITRMNLPCLIAVDRAGIVGSDGPTHHGVFDLSILTPLPHIVIFAPKDAKEAKLYINTVFMNFYHPYVVRIPRGKVENCILNLNDTIQIGSWTIEGVKENYDITIICYGDNVDRILTLQQQSFKIRVVNARFIKPLDQNILKSVMNDDKPVIVYETDLKLGSLGEHIASFCNDYGISKKFKHIAIDDHYSPQGSLDDIYREEKIDLDSVLQCCKEVLHEERKN
ncbi:MULTISPECIES: 1-deoxy-D-xylulose-5-phosphate synthase [Coprobacillaceae]|uniref:1-deoxy-D-xylulose-5-phosphate synthase n=1 Tax=Coprobacillaceae TaxID=2810280 RepID=UPI000E4859D0|nr:MULTISPECIES: 1-deoxy-D-xylulose-5-phosphate synthase [Coprobacillaceae]RHM63640.1 1-deoxy-D-xylulose-5-phosphate synthase [Coprobacillus sp. AF33-1AC]RHS96369.1 1-deoxy-D-xylulose-5-phosphate synthase [Erysipelatoclostridium sp. AM42-17]